MCEHPIQSLIPRLTEREMGGSEVFENVLSP